MIKPEVVKLEGQTRDIGKKSAKNLRDESLIPSVMYGPDIKENLHFSVDELELEKILRSSRTTIQEITIGDQTIRTLVKRVEFDPVSDRPLHVDFYALKDKHAVTLNVPVRLRGTAAGVREGGGRVFQPLRIIRVHVLPDKIPSLFEVDITNMEIGDSIHVSELEMEGIIPLDDPARTIVTISPPKSEELFKTPEPEVDEELEEGEEVEGEVAEGEAAEAEEGGESSEEKSQAE